MRPVWRKCVCIVNKINQDITFPREVWFRDRIRKWPMALRLCRVQIPFVNPVCWLLPSCPSGSRTELCSWLFPRASFATLKAQYWANNKGVLLLSLKANCSASAPGGVFSEYLEIEATVLHFLVGLHLGLCCCLQMLALGHVSLKASREKPEELKI